MGTISKGPYHNFYGASAAAPIPGPGIPSPEAGDMYFNTTAGPTLGLWYWDGATWVKLGTSGVDIRESKYIVGNTANADVAGVNVDYVDGPGVASALTAMAAAAVKNGRIYIREGSYIAPPPGAAPLYGSYQLSAYPALSGPIWIQGAGKNSCRITTGSSRPIFILDNPNCPVKMSSMLVEGVGGVDGVATGFATIEIGRSGRFPGATPNYNDNCTLDDIEVFAQGDFCALALCDAGPVPIPKGSDYFSAINCTFRGANGRVAGVTGNVVMTPNFAVTTATPIGANFVNCRFINAIGTVSGNGILAYSAYDAVFEGCEASNNEDSGFHIATASDIQMNNCVAANNTLVSGVGLAAGFFFNTVVDAALTGCIANINSAGVGVGGEGFLFVMSNSCTVSACLCNGGGDGVNQNGFRFNDSNYCLMDDCICWGVTGMGSTAYGNGFIIDGASSYCQINDCNAHDNQGYGAYLDIGTVRCEIVGGTFFNNGGSSGGPYDPNVYDAVPGGGTTNELVHFQYL